MTPPSNNTAEPGAGVTFLMDAGIRRKWVALAVFIGAFAGIVSITTALPNLYRATATVLVETQHVSEEFVRSSVSGEFETRLELIRQEIMSRARLTSLIGQFDLYADLRRKAVPFDEIVENLRRDIALELNNVSQSGRGPTIAFSISYSSRDAATAAQVANVLATSYVEENTRIRERQASRTAEFLKTQLADSKPNLDAQEQRLRTFNLTHMGELPQQVAANLASLERLNTQLRLNGDNQVRAMDRRDRLEKDLAELKPVRPAAAAAEPDAAGVADRVVALRKQLEELKGKFTDRYPEVVRVSAELAALERQLSELPGPSPTEKPPQGTASADDPRARLLQALSDSDAELRALKEEDVALRAAVSRYEQRVENVPKREEESQALTREYAASKERYDLLSKRYEEAQLASSLEHGQSLEQFRILDGAIPPREPAAPNRLRLLILGFVLAIGLAVAAVALAERLDTAFHSIDDLRSSVTVPMLFRIPLVPTRAGRRRHWRTVALTTVSVVVGVALIVSCARYVATGNEQLVRMTARGRL